MGSIALFIIHAPWGERHDLLLEILSYANSSRLSLLMYSLSLDIDEEKP